MPSTDLWGRRAQPVASARRNRLSPRRRPRGATARTAEREPRPRPGHARALRTRQRPTGPARASAKRRHVGDAPMKPPRSAPLPSRAPVATPWAPLTPALPGFSTPATLPGLAGHGQASVLALRQAFQRPELREEKGARTQRRRLWQLPPKFHCPVVGVCFTVEELRPWVVKMLGLLLASSDYELHVGAVGACASRTPFAEALQRRLEKRYATQLRRFAQARGPRRRPRAVARRGAQRAGDSRGAMWAAWTHPACDESLEQDIFRDIHMIQHQVGNATRADLPGGARRRTRGECRPAQRPRRNPAGARQPAPVAQRRTTAERADGRRAARPHRRPRGASGPPRSRAPRGAPATPRPAARGPDGRAPAHGRRAHRRARRPRRAARTRAHPRPARIIRTAP